MEKIIQILFRLGLIFAAVLAIYAFIKTRRGNLDDVAMKQARRWFWGLVATCVVLFVASLLIETPEVAPVPPGQVYVPARTVDGVLEPGHYAPAPSSPLEQGAVPPHDGPVTATRPWEQAPKPLPPAEPPREVAP